MIWIHAVYRMIKSRVKLVPYKTANLGETVPKRLASVLGSI